MVGRLSRVGETTAVLEPMRISDLVPLRRMLATDSVVLRVNPDGSSMPFEQMPALFFGPAIREILAEEVKDRFNQACATAIEHRTPLAFRADDSSTDEVMINPILDEDGIDCRFLVCWIRHGEDMTTSLLGATWEDLRLEEIITRYRLLADQTSVVVEAAPWWAPATGEVHELWPHHLHISAMGLGHAVIEALIFDAAEAAAEHGGGPAVRIEVPSADMLAGLVPVFHGAITASGLDHKRVIVAIDVELAVDPDLLPIIVHLRTFGLQIDIVGLDALTASLHRISDTSHYNPPLAPSVEAVVGAWKPSFEAATAEARNRG
jgi:hypothetical protein